MMGGLRRSVESIVRWSEMMLGKVGWREEDL